MSNRNVFAKFEWYRPVISAVQKTVTGGICVLGLLWLKGRETLSQKQIKTKRLGILFKK
jgi:hypothetical protein